MVRAARPCPLVNGPLMARQANCDAPGTEALPWRYPLTCCFVVERVTGIEPALSAWEAVLSELLSGLSCKEAYP